MREELFNKVHGVVYIPTRSYNAYQTWRDYSDAETERDLTDCLRGNMQAPQPDQELQRSGHGDPKGIYLMTVNHSGQSYIAEKEKKQ